MAQRLEQIAQRTESSPRQQMYANAARVGWLRSMRPPPQPQAQMQYRVTLAQELLRAGQNEQAIEAFEGILNMLDRYPNAPTSYRLAVKDYLAISYMRLGEMQNCVTDHNAQRCLFPIEGRGVYTQQRAPREAIKLYTDILEADPDDLNARWLLNVAHMTVGTYPDSIPSRWRIPPEALASEHPVNRFRDVAGPLGVDVMGLSGGSVVDDLNGDGHLDIMASSWGLRDQVRYFENTGDGRFVDRTEAAGLTGIVGGLNMVHADYNNDGHVDVLILRGAWRPEGHPNSLLRNDGDGTFTDVTEAAGLLDAHPTQTAAWADYNNDGHLDLFIGNESSTDEAPIPWIPPNAGTHPGELYRNNGDGTFTDVAADVGLDVVGYVKGVTWGDINNDGRMDLYVSVYDAPNRLYRNAGADAQGRWRFTEIGAAAGVQEPMESFPTWFWDYNNDGWLDLFVSGWRASAGDVAAEYLGQPADAELPRLYRNEGDGTFTDVTEPARLDRVLYSMGSNFGDLDNDGWLDAYVGTGDPDFRSLIPSRMFRNDGGTRFQEVTAAGGFGHLQKGHAISFADLDHDGDQDIHAVMGGAFQGDVFHNVLFENPGHDNHWITLRLEGTRSNRSAIGARLRLTVARGDTTRTIHRTVSTGGSFGASSLQQEIGLGRADALRSIAITWPSGTEQRFTDVAMNQIIHVREGADSVRPVEIEAFTLAPEAADPFQEAPSGR
jgi:tetratricopeptide (TPR) repeat protein